MKQLVLILIGGLLLVGCNRKPKEEGVLGHWDIYKTSEEHVYFIITKGADSNVFYI